MNPGAPVGIEDLCLLANTLAEHGLYEKAVQIYESACRLYPGNLALKINLGRVRSLQHHSLESPKDFLPAPKIEQPTTDLWANRYQGLGEIFLKNGRRDEAREIFELSKASNPSFYLPFLNLGRLYLDSGEFERAIAELEQARRFNPFNEEVCSLLGAVRFQNRDYRDALTMYVDALILSGEISKPASRSPYRTKIRECADKISGFSAKMRNDLIRDRRNRINARYEEFEQELRKSASVSSPQRETPTENPSIPASSQVMDAAKEADERKRTLEMVARLKRHLIFRNMDDEAVFKVARFTSDMRFLQGDFIFQESEPIYGLYLINRGKVEIQKSTPFGPIIYATFEKGEFFGDDNLLSGRKRFTCALAVHETDVLFIDKAGLATIFVREKAIAIHFLWYFWKSLSFQIREANDRMTSFFAGSSENAKREILAATVSSPGRPTHVEIDKKLEVLQTKGLTARELGLLARFSNEEMYNHGETIFREGELGDRLYIVLDGSVLISKQIPGVGEEALALLKKGDFFGEMALVGQHHRSADAKAQEQGTTVLVVTRDALREILAIDTDSAYQFLTILCRILSQRLLEMNEKIYQWRMMSGGF